MDRRQRSWVIGAPEVIRTPAQAASESTSPYHDDKYYDPPLSSREQQRSPAPQYEQFQSSYRSPEISEPSNTYHSSLLGPSPQLSDGTFSKSSAFSPLIQYTELYSTDPEVVYPEQEKEVAFTEQPISKALLDQQDEQDQQDSVRSIRRQSSRDTPQVWSAMDHDDFYQQRRRPKKPLYKRWKFVLAVAIVLLLVAVGVALAALFINKSRNQSGSSTHIGKNKPNVDLNTSVGGYINDAYYSKTGAWNGSGIAIAAANPDYNQAIYAFYQDYTGAIQYTLMNQQNEWNLVGPVNSNSYRALNGTPLSTVQHQLGHERVWHLFYIDEDYIIRERIMTNTTTTGPTATWTDGPLSNLNLTAWNSTTIGMQGCYWGNYYGLSGSGVDVGIHLWYASDATTFQQYNWANGSDSWTFVQEWPDLSGSGGVGCQTWDTGLTEYVWFVDNNSSLAMYWKDNNRTAPSTTTHPTLKWTKVDVDVDNVQQDSSLGYTNYMIWQDKDTTIRGANVTWGAESTKIAAGNGPNGLDTWTLQQGGNNVYAVRGTHLSITAVKTVSNGASLLAFLQQTGDDLLMFTRDAFNSGALWQTAAQDPVTPSNNPG